MFLIGLATLVKSLSLTAEPIPTSFKGRFIPLSVYEQLGWLESQKNPILGALDASYTREGLPPIWSVHFFERFDERRNLSAFESRHITLKQQLHPADLTLRLEQEFPLSERLKNAGHILKVLPGKLNSGEWYSPHALHVHTSNPLTGQLELVNNFTLYDDAHFAKIRDLYFLWEEAVLAANQTAEIDLRNSFYALLANGYKPIANFAYTQASGKQLSYPSIGQLRAEELYYRYPLIPVITALYALTCALFIFYAKMPKKGMYICAYVAAIGGFILHTLLLAMRCYILGRPPVANMLETVLYVPWVAMAIGVIMSGTSKKILPLASAALVGAVLLILKASALHDKLENVQAVLDSRYWLTIHVLMVVGSYGVFILSSIMGHVYLLSACCRTPPLSTAPSNHITSAILRTMYLGTALLIGGTILGGIWAAESWGRFWDWDPKESWAFISICIYLLWIHAYRFHYIGPLGLAVGSIMGVLMISFTWYGVNYILGTGLHSYGFGNGGGQTIYYSYLFAELIFVATMATVACKRGLRKSLQDK
jgi:ABC-type transport system involved in cytochrome c biogenesis permease subunit